VAKKHDIHLSENSEKIQTSLLIQVQQLQVGINRIRNSAPRNFQRQPRFNKMKFYAASQDYVELRRAELHIKARQFMMQIQAANIINKVIFEITIFPAANFSKIKTDNLLVTVPKKVKCVNKSIVL
jgi:hypothetical protein